MGSKAQEGLSIFYASSVVSNTDWVSVGSFVNFWSNFVTLYVFFALFRLESGLRERMVPNWPWRRPVRFSMGKSKLTTWKLAAVYLKVGTSWDYQACTRDTLWCQHYITTSKEYFINCRILLQNFELVFLQLQLLKIVCKLIVIWVNYEKNKTGSLFMKHHVYLILFV